MPMVPRGKNRDPPVRKRQRGAGDAVEYQTGSQSEKVSPKRPSSSRIESDQTLSPSATAASVAVRQHRRAAEDEALDAEARALAVKRRLVEAERLAENAEVRMSDAIVRTESARRALQDAERELADAKNELAVTQTAVGNIRQEAQLASQRAQALVPSSSVTQTQTQYQSSVRLADHYVSYNQHQANRAHVIHDASTDYAYATAGIPPEGFEYLLAPPPDYLPRRFAPPLAGSPPLAHPLPAFLPMTPREASQPSIHTLHAVQVPSPTHRAPVTSPVKALRARSDAMYHSQHSHQRVHPPVVSRNSLPPGSPPDAVTSRRVSTARVQHSNPVLLPRHNHQPMFIAPNSHDRSSTMHPALRQGMAAPNDGGIEGDRVTSSYDGGDFFDCAERELENVSPVRPSKGGQRHVLANEAGTSKRNSSSKELLVLHKEDSRDSAPIAMAPGQSDVAHATAETASGSVEERSRPPRYVLQQQQQLQHREGFGGGSSQNQMMRSHQSQGRTAFTTVVSPSVAGAKQAPLRRFHRNTVDREYQGSHPPLSGSIQPHGNPELSPHRKAVPLQYVATLPYHVLAAP
ncbi:hypothetical protein DIPPA_70149 [Diplonema papillatum]|nr:hypothetical protein DIPPA_70149 [Diplonema papillatum]